MNATFRCSKVVRLLLFSITITLGRAQLDAPPPPIYEGKPLGYWLAYLEFSNFCSQGFSTERGFPERYSTIEQAEKHQKSIAEIRKAAPKAITGMGLETLPYLYRMLLYDGSPDSRLDFLWKPADGIPRDETPEIIRGTAVVAFESLKQFRPTIEPQLRVFLHEKGLRDDAKGAVLGALHSIGASIKEEIQNDNVKAENIRARQEGALPWE